MSLAAAHRHTDSSLVLRTLTVILLSGASLLAALRDPAAMITGRYLVALGVLWGALLLEMLPVRGWLRRERLDAVLVAVDILAVGLVVAAVPELPGVSIYFLGPVATAAVRLGREGATAAAAVAALGLLLPALLTGGSLQPVDVATAVGAVLLLASGLAAGELVRVADRWRRVEQATAVNARRVDHELRMILDNLGSGLLTVDAHGAVMRVNPAARSILGLGDRSISQSPLVEVLGEAGRELSDLVERVPGRRRPPQAGRGAGRARRQGRPAGRQRRFPLGRGRDPDRRRGGVHRPDRGPPPARAPAPQRPPGRGRRAGRQHRPRDPQSPGQHPRLGGATGQRARRP